jgi:Mitochondrial carrier protein
MPSTKAAPSDATAINTATLASNALGSATAGVVARIVTHPLDTAKARLQNHGGPHRQYGGAFDVLRSTLRHEGVRGLYRGFGPVIVGGTPGTVVYLCSYEYFKAHLLDVATKDARTNAGNAGEEPAATFLVHFVSGLLAETVACLVYVPVDVIKERLQVQHATDSFRYKGGWDALVQISRTEGFRGMYKGYGATLASFGSFSALYFMLYEKFKLWSGNYYHRTMLFQQQQQQPSSPASTSTSTSDPQPLPFPWIVLSSAGAGAIASFVTSPLDMAKLRLQVQRASRSSPSSSSSSSSPSTTTTSTVTTYRGIGDALRFAHRQGGMKGLFRGAGARVLHFVPATTVTMTCYETCRTFFHQALT